MTQQILRNIRNKHYYYYYKGMQAWTSYSIVFYSVLLHSMPFRSIPFHSISFYSILFDYLRFYSILFYSQTHEPFSRSYLIPAREEKGERDGILVCCLVCLYPP